VQDDLKQALSVGDEERKKAKKQRETAEHATGSLEKLAADAKTRV
jgi:hypothetical protein